MSNRYTTRECKHCGIMFKAKRSDTLYCSKTCKQYAYNQRIEKGNNKLCRSQNQKSSNAANLPADFDRQARGYLHQRMLLLVKEYIDFILSKDSFNLQALSTFYVNANNFRPFTALPHWEKYKLKQLFTSIWNDLHVQQINIGKKIPYDESINLEFIKLLIEMYSEFGKFRDDYFEN